MRFDKIPLADPLRILVVDDEEPVRRSVTQNLRIKLAKTYQAREVILLEAATKEAACQLIRASFDLGTPIDLILTDVVMDANERSGLEVLEEALAIDPNVFVILNTAKAIALDRHAAMTQGAFEVIDKVMLRGQAITEIVLKTQIALRCRDWRKQSANRWDYLCRYVDRVVLDWYETDRDQLELRAQYITICFWDIRGFTRMCDQLKHRPLLVTHFLTEYGAQAVDSIRAHGGALDKFIGDGVMALFGITPSRTNLPGRGAAAAANAALDLRNRFAKLLQKWQKIWEEEVAFHPSIGLGCGINTDEALVGNAGTDARDQFTALGAPVNLAARIEARSTKAQILVSGTTKPYLTPELGFHLTERDPILDLKGYEGTKFPVYEVNSQPPAVSR